MGSSKKTITVPLIIVLCMGSALFGFFITKDKEDKIYSYDPGGYFVTNVVDSKNLLKAGLIIEVSGKEQYEELSKNNCNVRDAIICVLRNKAYEEIRDPQIQNELKNEINKMLSRSFDINTIQNIYFNEFVIQ